jgi:hypothetical protein
MIPATVFQILHLASLTPTFGLAVLWVLERERRRAESIRH